MGDLMESSEEIPPRGAGGNALRISRSGRFLYVSVSLVLPIHEFLERGGIG